MASWTRTEEEIKRLSEIESNQDTLLLLPPVPELVAKPFPCSMGWSTSAAASVFGSAYIPPPPPAMSIAAMAATAAAEAAADKKMQMDEEEDNIIPPLIPVRSMPPPPPRPPKEKKKKACGTSCMVSNCMATTSIHRCDTIGVTPGCLGYVCEKHLPPPNLWGLQLICPVCDGKRVVGPCDICTKLLIEHRDPRNGEWVNNSHLAYREHLIFCVRRTGQDIYRCFGCATGPQRNKHCARFLQGRLN